MALLLFVTVRLSVLFLFFLLLLLINMLNFVILSLTIIRHINDMLFSILEAEDDYDESPILLKKNSELSERYTV